MARSSGSQILRGITGKCKNTYKETKCSAERSKNISITQKDSGFRYSEWQHA